MKTLAGADIELGVVPGAEGDVALGLEQECAGRAIEAGQQAARESEKIAQRRGAEDQPAAAGEMEHDEPRDQPPGSPPPLDRRRVRTVQHQQDMERARLAIEQVLKVQVNVSAEAGKLTAPMADADLVTDLLIQLRSAGIALSEMSVQKPTLDEVFLTITGHNVKEETSRTSHESNKTEVTSA